MAADDVHLGAGTTRMLPSVNKTVNEHYQDWESLFYDQLMIRSTTGLFVERELASNNYCIGRGHA